MCKAADRVSDTCQQCVGVTAVLELLVPLIPQFPACRQLRMELRVGACTRKDTPPAPAALSSCSKTPKTTLRAVSPPCSLAQTPLAGTPFAPSPAQVRRQHESRNFGFQLLIGELVPTDGVGARERQCRPTCGLQILQFGLYQFVPSKGNPSGKRVMKQGTEVPLSPPPPFPGATRHVRQVCCGPVLWPWS